MQLYHKPVLVSEVLHYIAPKHNATYVDVTFGGGGHTRAMLQAEPTCTVIALDWDKKAIDLNAPPLEQDYGSRFKILWGNFSHVAQILKKAGIGKVDGILADFGTSQYQIFESEGFSFARDTFLDMRMSPGHQKHTAYDLVNRATVQELEYIFKEYGQERFAGRIARALEIERKKKPIKTTGQLADIIADVVGRKPGKKIHPATQVFQGLRIAVNKELDNIKAFLSQSLDLLKPEGRLVCISFHSLEDRLVKQFFRDHKDKLEILTPKVITASPEENTQNPSARSARLRASQRL